MDRGNHQAKQNSADKIATYYTSAAQKRRQARATAATIPPSEEEDDFYETEEDIRAALDDPPSHTTGCADAGTQAGTPPKYWQAAAVRHDSL